MATPQFLVAFLGLLAACWFALSSPTADVPSGARVEVGAGGGALEERTITLVLFDQTGQSSRHDVVVAVAPGRNSLLAAALAALQAEMAAEGLWPNGLAGVRSYLVDVGAAEVAVMDLYGSGVGITVEAERALLMSLVGTAQRNGADEVRFLRDGEPTDTLLGHLAVTSAL